MKDIKDDYEWFNITLSFIKEKQWKELNDDYEWFNMKKKKREDDAKSIEKLILMKFSWSHHFWKNLT